MTRVAIATFSGMPPEFRDDVALLDQLSARGADVAYHPWDDASLDWGAFELVVARSPWDYTTRRDEFLDWADRIGGPLENPPAVLRWNSDKLYLGDLAAAGLPVVPTTYVKPGDQMPPIDGEVVMKPAVSAGARDTGRFGPASSDLAAGLVARICASGGTAMVQPHLGSVDEVGETAIVVIDGEVSHVLRKRALLNPDQIAPMRDDSLGVAEVMYDPDLVVAGSATGEELELTRRVVEDLSRRFGPAPLTVRVDMLRSDGGGGPSCSSSRRSNRTSTSGRPSAPRTVSPTRSSPARHEGEHEPGEPESSPAL